MTTNELKKGTRIQLRNGMTNNIFAIGNKKIGTDTVIFSMTTAAAS